MITTKEMKELEELSEQAGVTKIELMENAGIRIAEQVDEYLGDETAGKKVLFVCGPGNNGGDGFVAARLLIDHCKVDVLFLGDKNNLPNEARINYEQLKCIDPCIIVDYDSEAPYINFQDYSVIVDAMLGTGSKGYLEHPYNIIVCQINESKAFRISVDIPTGINPDRGTNDDCLFVDADLIITFHDIKPGLKQFKDKVRIADIGIPF
jgi:ADP-dependent NAD(P)H-hydrate dehydratase / NAD(P)H-hydrate epimerase